MDKNEPKVLVRMTRWTNSYTRAEHKDFDITGIAFWEAPAGWMLACIAVGEKGLPPWDEPPMPSAQVVGKAPVTHRPIKRGDLT